MKKEIQTKKLSLKKTQIIKVNNLKRITGGGGGLEMSDSENDETTGATKPPVTYTGR